MAKKVVVTGGSGLLGRAVAMCLQFTEETPTSQGIWNFEVQRWVFSRLRDPHTDKKVDISKKDEVDKAIDEFKPDAIVHCAAIRSPDLVSKQEDLAKSINVLGSQNVAEAAARHKAKLIYISTDYVFDGKSPPYAETAQTNPLNEYGRQKLAGEKVTLEKCPDAIILRVPLLYGPVEYLGEGPVDVLLKAVLDRSKKTEMSDYERRYPIHVYDVAAAIRVLLERHFQYQQKTPGNKGPVQGVYHWSGNEEMTKNDIAKIMGEVFKLPIDHLIPNPDPPADGAALRPYNSRLSCQRLTELGAQNKYRFKDGIANALRKFVPST